MIRLHSRPCLLTSYLHPSPLISPYQSRRQSILVTGLKTDVTFGGLIYSGDPPI